MPSFVPIAHRVYLRVTRYVCLKSPSAPRKGNLYAKLCPGPHGSAQIRLPGPGQTLMDPHRPGRLRYLANKQPNYIIWHTNYPSLGHWGFLDIHIVSPGDIHDGLLAQN